VTQTATATQTVTATATGTGGAASPYRTFANDTLTWPFKIAVQSPKQGITGDLSVYLPVSIPYQADPTIPGTAAMATHTALMNAYPNLNISYTNPGWNGQPFLFAAQAGNLTWDAIRFYPLYDWMTLGYFEPLTSYFNDWTDKGAFDASTLATRTYNGDLYMVPENGDPKSGWWRKDLFAKAGYGTWDPTTGEYTGTAMTDMNYSELLQAMGKITQQNSANGIYATYFPMAPSQPNIVSITCMLNYFRANGASVWHGTNTTCSIDLDQSPNYNKALDTLDFMQQAIQGNLLNPGFQTFDLNRLITDLTTGTVGFFYGIDANLDSQYITIPYSKVMPGGPSGPTLLDAMQPSLPPSDGNLSSSLPPCPNMNADLAIVKGSKNPDAAWEWIRTMASFPRQLCYPVNGAGFPGRTDVLSVITQQTCPNFYRWIKALPTNMLYEEIPLLGPYGTLLSNDFLNAFSTFFAGTGKPEDAIANFATSARNDLQKAGISAAS